MKAWMQPLEAMAGYEDLCRQLVRNRGLISVSGCLDSQKVHLAAGLSGDSSAVLLVAENERKARELYEDSWLMGRETFFYPRRDLLFYQADVAGNTLTRQRIQVIQALLEGRKIAVITSTGGCMDFLLPLRTFREHILELQSDSELHLESFIRQMVEIGYERCGEVSASGQFSVRGGIIDIFPLTEENPWRIELWGDQVDSIRSFDAESQRSIENLEEIRIYPATEDIGRETDPEGGRAFYRKLTDTLIDYLPEDARIFLDEPQRIFEAAGAISGEYQEAVRHRLEAGKMEAWAANRMVTAEHLKYLAARGNCLALSLMTVTHLGLDLQGEYDVTARSVNSYNNQFPLLVKDMQKWKRSGSRVLLFSASRTRGRRLAEELLQEGLNAFYSEDADREIRAGEVMVTHGNIRRGFEYPLQKFVLITESDIFGQEKKKKKRKKKDAGEKIRSFEELSVGDYVIHENHGLGIYRGMEKVEIDHVTRDFIRIEYASNGSLFVPAAQLALLQKYVGKEGRKPQINKLGGQEWSGTRSRVRRAVRDIARDLVRLYAARQQQEGYQFGPDTVWQTEFEEMFPFEETEDQLQAIEDTKRDMESRKIMDRLICGDVGYGKTEIAIRAAFKAVQESKQVVVLVPTTILAQQHYRTFSQRMKDFPVRIDSLSRFRTPAQQKKTLEDLKKGQVDILIGTHRVLSKDVQFRDLGLLIIDEEQRFGVTHKEKIKKMKENVSVLTLTATPIPRTLHMSMIGIRDMSVLEEAPMDRLPIQTYVMEYDEEMVREAISRELARDGQVFYVYNRVSNIADVAGRIQTMLPDANVAYAHGKMNEHELEAIMYDFINGDIDVLVSTTIIETGMDISNVNTIIIQDADRMGLSQLYQLRGRVGRTNRTAYAFLMYKRDRMLREEAEKRLHAIREFTELGSGVKIAMRDLEIRGAGNILGAQQSGHMEAVGYDLYCKMLNEAIREEKGEKAGEDFDTSVDLAIDAFLPDTYVTEEAQKLELYKRIAGIETEEDAEDMLEELIDRFGDPPRAVQNLVHVSELRALAHSADVTEIRQTREAIRIGLYERARYNPREFPDLMERHRNQLFFKMGQPPCFLWKPDKNVRSASQLLLHLKMLLQDMRALL